MASSQAEQELAAPSGRDQVFVSYCHKDKRWLERLRTQLAPLVRSGGLDVWDDSRIAIGAEWREEIRKALARAKVAVLLVTPDFLASEFIARKELPPLLGAARAEGLTIFWVAVKSSLYSETEIADYQAANDPARPLAKLASAHVDEELVRIARAIKGAFSANP